MGVFNRIYAFEPDERNYNAMLYRLERLKKEWAIDSCKLIPVKAGVGERTNTATFTSREKDNSSLGASFSKTKETGGTDVLMYSIDDYFKDIAISFIKADIESYEYDMILGAKSTIIKHHPKMAVCIYHGASDIFDIPLLILSIYPEYKMAIRQHAIYDFLDTVLYVY